MDWDSGSVELSKFGEETDEIEDLLRNLEFFSFLQIQLY